MNLVTYSPDQTFESFFDTKTFFGFPQTHEDQPTELPKINVIEQDEAFHLEAETPGVTQKDISIEFHDGILSLKGTHKQNSESEKTDYRIQEFRKKNFSRSFRLNDQIDSEKVIARMDQGILKITLPKKEQAKPKKIEIKVST